jgi:hypothetical protein
MQNWPNGVVSLLSKHHTIIEYRWRGSKLDTFYISVQSGDSGQLYTLTALARYAATGANCTGGWVGPRVVLDTAMS